MSVVRRRFLAGASLAAMMMAASPSAAQQVNGFLANFHPNNSPGNTLSLVVFGDPGTTGTISNVGGFNLDFTIDASGVFQTPIAGADGEMPMDGAVNGNSLLVTASNAVSGIALNRQPFTSDQTSLLVLDALGTEYYVIGFSGVFGGSQLSVTAVADGTEVTITSPAALTGGGAPDTPFVVMLNAGESVSYGTPAGGDVTGTRVVANLPVAVFAGARCTQVPVGVIACDHLIEQNFSVDNFDTDFLLSVNFGGGTDADLIRVIASQDNTEVFLDGVSQGTINAGQFLQIDNVGNARLTASNPVQVGQFTRGQGGTRTTGDPAFAIVPSVNQWLDSYAYATPIDTEAFGQNFINVAIAEGDVASLLLNETAVDSSGFVLFDGFLFGNVAITPGFGTISADNPFLAMIAGFNDFDSYFSAIATSFSAGASPPPPNGLRDITQVDDVDSQLGITLNPIFAGGTLSASTDQTRDFQIRNSGGTILVADGVAVTYSGVISDFAGDSGAMTKAGPGTLTFSGVNTYTGGTRVAGGTLRLANGASLASGVINNATFAAGGTATVNGNFMNAGVIDLADGVAGDQLVINGNYSAMNGVLEVDVALNRTGGGTADRLVVNGNVGNGTTRIDATLTGVGSITGRGPGRGIPVVQVSGTTDAADFSLGGTPIQNNVFLYSLNLETDSNWYLQSMYLPTIPAYEVYPSALLNIAQASRLRDRVADRISAGRTSVPTGQGADTVTVMDQPWLHPEIWARVEGARIRRGLEASITNTVYSQNFVRLQAGVDIPVGTYSGGDLIAGINAQYVRSNVDVTSPHGNSTIGTDSYGIGATLTWYGSNGFYVDAQGTYFGHRSNLIGQANRNNGSSGSFSIEAGQRFDIAPEWTITPQAQFSYATANFRAFTGPFGERVSLREGDSARFRIGATVDRSWQGENGANSFFVSANVIGEGSRTTGVNVTTGPNTFTFNRQAPSAYGELGVGGQFSLGENAYVGAAAYVERGFNSGARTNFRGNATLNIRW